MAKKPVSAQSVEEAQAELWKELVFINKVTQAARTARDRIKANGADFNDIRSEMNILLERAAPTFLYLKLAALLETTVRVLWTIPTTNERTETKPAKRTEILARECGFNNSSLEVLIALRNDIAHEIRYETTWEAVDAATEHLALMFTKLRVKPPKF